MMRDVETLVNGPAALLRNSPTIVVTQLQIVLSAYELLLLERCSAATIQNPASILLREAVAYEAIPSVQITCFSRSTENPRSRPDRKQTT